MPLGSCPPGPAQPCSHPLSLYFPASSLGVQPTSRARPEGTGLGLERPHVGGRQAKESMSTECGWGQAAIIPGMGCRTDRPDWGTQGGQDRLGRSFCAGTGCASLQPQGPL